ALAVTRREEVRDRTDLAVAEDDVALVREVDARQRDLLQRDVAPHVELGPVAEREGADVLTSPAALGAATDATVVEGPELGSLAARFPLTELVAEGEDAFLRPRFLLAPAGAADQGVEAMFGDRVQQRWHLGAVPTRGRAG